MVFLGSEPAGGDVSDKDAPKTVNDKPDFRSFDEVAADEKYEQFTISSAGRPQGFNLNEVGELGSDALHWWSITGGLLGLGAMFLLWMLVISAGRGLIDINGILSFSTAVVLGQSLAFPALAVAVTLISVTMFFCRNVFGRFLIAGLLLLPGVFSYGTLGAFVASKSIQLNIPHAVPTMFAMFVSASIVGFAFQLWSPWQLTPQRIAEERKTIWGTRLLMELTAVIAVIYIIGQWLAPSGMEFTADVIGLILFVSFLSLTAMFGIVACLGERRLNLKWLLGAFALSWAVSIGTLTPFATQEFGRSSVAQQFPLIAMLATVGAFAIALPMVVSLYWLRLCGWRCLKQSAENVTRY